MQTIQDHPDFKRMQADVDAAKRVQAQQALAQEIEAQQLRANQGQYLAKKTQDAIDEYEALRPKLHEVVGRIFQANLEYSNLTRSNAPGYSEHLIGTINLPSLRHVGWTSSFTTTAAAITQFFANMGRWS